MAKEEIEESPPLPNENGKVAKFYSVKLEPEIAEKLEDLKRQYRSPSISHTFRIMIEDLWLIEVVGANADNKQSTEGE